VWKVVDDIIVEDLTEGPATTGSIVLNSTAEFCRTLGDIPTYGQAGNREEDVQELLVSLYIITCNLKPSVKQYYYYFQSIKHLYYFIGFRERIESRKTSSRNSRFADHWLE